jgi:hypothetical protein
MKRKLKKENIISKVNIFPSKSKRKPLKLREKKTTNFKLE